MEKFYAEDECIGLTYIAVVKRPDGIKVWGERADEDEFILLGTTELIADAYEKASLVFKAGYMRLEFDGDGRCKLMHRDEFGDMVSR